MLAPTWFKEALDAPVAERTTHVDGVPIHYLDWGEPGQPGRYCNNDIGDHISWCPSA